MPNKTYVSSKQGVKSGIRSEEKGPYIIKMYINKVPFYAYTEQRMYVMELIFLPNPLSSYTCSTKLGHPIQVGDSPPTDSCPWL